MKGKIQDGSVGISDGMAIHGESDEFGSVAFPRMIEGGISGPSDVLIMEGVGHVPHRERPDEVLDAVERFLESRKIR